MRVHIRANSDANAIRSCLRDGGAGAAGLNGTVIRTDRVAAPGRNGADLWWSGKHKHHSGNIQVISAPDGWPLWVSPVGHSM